MIITCMRLSNFILNRLRSRRAMVRFSLLDLQRLIDLSRVDPTQPIDLSTICNTGLFRVDADHDRHYGFHLTEEASSEICYLFPPSGYGHIYHTSEY